MSRNLQAILQVALMSLQTLNVSGALTPKGQLWIGAIISSVQMGLGVAGHAFNPDGTSAQVAYVPPTNPQQ